jgi:hypothetical protein
MSYSITAVAEDTRIVREPRGRGTFAVENRYQRTGNTQLIEKTKCVP